MSKNFVFKNQNNNINKNNKPHHHIKLNTEKLFNKDNHINLND